MLGNMLRILMLAIAPFLCSVLDCGAQTVLGSSLEVVAHISSPDLSTAQGANASRASDASPVAFRSVMTTSAPWTLNKFHGSIPGPPVPLSTLRPGLCRPLRMTRGRCGSPGLHRVTLAFTTPRRFSSAHHDFGLAHLPQLDAIFQRDRQPFFRNPNNVDYCFLKTGCSAEKTLVPAR